MVSYKTTLAVAVIYFVNAFAAEAVAHDKMRHANAVTLWWVIFNNPDACLAAPGKREQCGSVDVFGQAFLDSVAEESPNPSLISPNTAAGVGVIYATGDTTRRRSGRIRLAASIYRSHQPLLLQGEQVVDPLGLGVGFQSDNPEIHLVVRSHGAVERDGRTTQITNFLEPYCSDPLLLFEGGDNVCEDVQVAVFAPGETGDDVVLRTADGTVQPRATATLYRQGDIIQAVVETKVR